MNIRNKTTLVRQAKLGITGKVQVLAWKGLASHHLGFTYTWIVSRTGKDIITHTTSKKKFNTSVQKIKQWIKQNRHVRIRKLVDLLNKKRKGYNYYGLVGNYKMLDKMDLVVTRLLYKWMNRRSQRRSFNWTEFKNKLKRHYPIQKLFVESLNEQMELII